MKIRHITCSDPREHNPIKEIINLAHLPHAEIAVQCHPSKMSAGMPRNIWFNELIKETLQTTHVNLALHINAEWANDICVNGVIPNIILNWITITKSRNNPVIKRVQLNMPKNTADNINVRKLNKIIHEFKNIEFIFQYNEKTKHGIQKMHRSGSPFSLLFDASGGMGVSPEKWEKPVYKNHPMGYSGGISVENVMQNLDKIAPLVGEDEIWIDAEGKLKSSTLFEEKALFDANLARAYIQRANMWQKIH